MDTSFLSGTVLFRGIAPDDIATMLPCLNAHERSYAKDEVILRAGNAATEVGVVLAGSANVVASHYWGGSTLFGHVGCGDIFAENYAAVPGRELLVDVVAAEQTKVLFLNMDKMLSSCARTCPFHARVIHNLLRVSAQKNIGLSARMMHIAPKTIRERLLSYLSEQAVECASNRFTIPYSRQQLADYLGVDRSALSNELSKMRRDGLVSFRRNEFELHRARGDVSRGQGK